MVPYIQVEDQIIEKGIFHFVYQVTGHEAVSELLFEMEKKYHTDRIGFSSGMRHVLEKFVYCEFCRVYGVPYDPTYSWKKATGIVTDIILSETQNIPLISKVKSPIKAFLYLRCCNEDHLDFFKAALKRWRKKPYYTAEDLQRAIEECYGFSCNEHHEKPVGIDSYDINEANEKNCKKWLYFLYYLLQGYCACYFPDFPGNQSPDENYVPLEDYVRVPRSISTLLGVPEVARKSLYVSDKGDGVKYYWISDANRDNTQNREIEALQKIWSEDNDFDPRNVIRLKETLFINDKLSKLVFALPSKPMLLSWNSALENTTIPEREKIFMDAVRSISSLHDNLPPLYHRDITPEAFILCKAKNGYKLFLNAFDCVKDTDKNVKYTVGNKVSDNMEKARKKPYLAPEIMNLKDTDDAWKDVDWRKADIYALGVLGIFIFTGRTDINLLQQVEGLDSQIISKIQRMCAPIAHRPSHI